MEETKKQDAGQELDSQQVGEVAGGTPLCGASATLSGNPSVTNTAATPGEALIGIYDGMVDATSHVMETVINAVKN